MEKSFTVKIIGERQVVTEAITYHIGFARKPAWLSDQDARMNRFTLRDRLTRRGCVRHRKDPEGGGLTMWASALRSGAEPT